MKKESTTKNMSFKGKVIVLALASVMFFGALPAQAFADSKLDKPGASISEYQFVLDKVNKELGSAWRFTTQADVDWSYARMTEQCGYLPEGGPQAATLERLQQYTLREFEAMIRESDRASRTPSEPTARQTSQGNTGYGNEQGGSQTRHSYFTYGYFPYGETAGLWATKSGSVFTKMQPYGAVYLTSQVGFENGYCYFQANSNCSYSPNPTKPQSGDWTFSLPQPSTVQVTWTGWDFGSLIVQYSSRTAYFQ